MEKCGEKFSKKDGFHKSSENVFCEIIKLAIPAILSMVVLSLFSVCDTYFLGEMGEIASAGVCYPVVAVMQGIAMTFAFGSANHISLSIGGGKKENAVVYFSSGLIFSLIACLFLGLAVGVFSNSLVSMFGGGNQSSGGAIYLSWFGYFFILPAIYIFLSAILRAQGRVNIVMIASVLGLACNFLLNYLCVKVFLLGVFSIVISTAIAQGIGAFVMIFYLLISCGVVKFSFFSFDIFAVWDIITLGSSSFFRQVMCGVSAVAINIACGKIGGDTLAGASCASKVSVLVFSVGLGLGQGMQPVMAYYFGGKDYNKVMKALKITLVLGVCSGVLLGFVQFVCADKMAEILCGGDGGNIASAVLKVSAFSLVFSFLLVIINMAFQAVAKKWQNVALSVLRQGLIFVPVLFVLSERFGLIGIVISHAVSDFLSFLVAVILLLCSFKNGWKSDV